MNFYANFSDEEEFEETKIVKQERQIIGYCFYSKDEIRDGDDFLMYKGHMYLKDNFLQASLGLDGEIIDAEEAEE